MANKEKPALTPKQARFVEHYLIDLNATAAARRAGYSVRTAKSIGQENLTKPAVMAAIAARKGQEAEKTGLTIAYVERMGIELLERCMQHRPVLRGGEPVTVETETGEISAVYTFDAAGARGALDILARRVGFYELDHKQSRVVERVAHLTDSERARMMERIDEYIDTRIPAGRPGVDRVADAGPGHSTTH